MGEQMFQALVDHPEGVFIGKCDPEKNLGALRTEDHRINVFIPELADWVQSITPESEERTLRPNPDYPLMLMAGRHKDENANTIMRDPAWNQGRPRVCTLAMHPADATALGLNDAQMVRIVTEAGEEILELEVSEEARRGHVAIPHGFGLVFQGKKYGANVNRLTKNTNRDKLAATPLHRYVPCRVDAA